MAVRVKICGLTRVEDAVAACEFGADLLGLNFYPGSPRAVDVERAREIRKAVGDDVPIVGVFVNAPRSEILETVELVGLNVVQLHGDEPDDFLRGEAFPIIRARRLSATNPVSRSLREAVAAPRELLLLDCYHPQLFGGTGQMLPLEMLMQLDLKRAIIAGGLRPENVAAVAALKPWGVDAASGIEREPGVKDHPRMREFVVNAKSA